MSSCKERNKKELFGQRPGMEPQSQKRHHFSMGRLSRQDPFGTKTGNLFGFGYGSFPESGDGHIDPTIL